VGLASQLSVWQSSEARTLDSPRSAAVTVEKSAALFVDDELLMLRAQLPDVRGWSVAAGEAQMAPSRCVRPGERQLNAASRCRSESGTSRSRQHAGRWEA
jgi:hypothetical protein